MRSTYKVARLAALAVLAFALLACSRGGPGAESQSSQTLVTRVTADNVRLLLTLEEVQAAAGPAGEAMTVSLVDSKETVASVDPRRAAQMDAWYTLTFQVEDGTKAIGMGVIDFTAPGPAQDHLALQEQGGLEVLSEAIGEKAVGKQLASSAVLAFGVGDKVVHLFSTPGRGGPLADLEGLVALGRIVEGRLGP